MSLGDGARSGSCDERLNLMKARKGRQFKKSRDERAAKCREMKAMVWGAEGARSGREEGLWCVRAKEGRKGREPAERCEMER